MPQNDWILDVLSDLKSFAAANGMRALAEQLDDTKLIAAAEIASKKEEARVPGNGNEGRLEPCPRGVGRQHHA